MDEKLMRAHDLAVMYITRELEEKRIDLPKADQIGDFCGHYRAILNDFLEAIEPRSE